MDMMLLYREWVSNYMLLGAKCELAYEMAVVDVVSLGPIRKHLLVHDLSARDAIKRVLEEVVKGGLPVDFESMQMVVGGDSGPLVRIPHPSCMERHLPKDRGPTREEFDQAWEKCASTSP